MDTTQTKISAAEKPAEKPANLLPNGNRAYTLTAKGRMPLAFEIDPRGQVYIRTTMQTVVPTPAHLVERGASACQVRETHTLRRVKGGAEAAWLKAGAAEYDARQGAV